MASKPKLKSAVKHSSKDLIRFGPREVSANAKKSTKAEDVKPTTSRALVLRNGKYGVQGTGEPLLMSRISGREKLDLLAEDLVEKSSKAISAPFDIQRCLQITESQYDLFLSDIWNLRDHEAFHNLIGAEVEARTRFDPEKPDPKKNPSHIAKVIGTRIHNTYMLASAWKIVRDAFYELVHRGMTNKNVKSLLKNDTKMRNLYLALFHMVGQLVDISQNKFSVLALNSPHYAKYFKEKRSDGSVDEPEIVFDHSELREAAMSFIDSLIIELCFPQSPYPRFILYQILHDAADESPRDTRRFSQLMWDAVGDLSECVELYQFLEGPLLAPEAKEWENDTRQTLHEFELWLDTQMLSLTVSEEIANFKDLIYPLSKTTEKAMLDNMWTRINSNYLRVTGKNLDDLWQLRRHLERTPQWTSFYLPGIPEDSYKSDVEDSRPSFLRTKGKGKPKRPLAITTGSGGESDFEDMPGLQTVSNSSEDYSSEDSDSEDDWESHSGEESGYDTEEEDEIRELLREAMDVAHEADWFNTTPAPSEADPMKIADERGGNPFLKLLGSLRGRLFDPDPKLKALGAHGQVKKPRATKDTSHTQIATVEEVTDEEKPYTTVKKKKKKYKKKKKPASAAEPLACESNQVPPSPTPAVQDVQQAPTSPRLPPTKGNPSASARPPPGTQAPAMTPKPKLMASTALLPTFETTTSHAESARTYLNTLESHKVKSKTRSDQASIFSNDDKPKAGRGIMSRLGFSKKPEMEKEEQKAARRSWFSKLSTKAEGLMHHLLRTSDDIKQGHGGMRWDDFVKLMTEMGFSYDPTTAGSSVRFIPPGKDDHPISFHKPHPKPYIEAGKLRGMAKRLKKHYGWGPEVFANRAQVFASEQENDKSDE